MATTPILHPAILLNQWAAEAQKCGAAPLLMNVATSKKDGKVSNRTMHIKEILPDASLTFTTSINSNKVQDINENPQVAFTILYMYFKNCRNVTRQVRGKGVVVKLSQEHCRLYLEKEKKSRGGTCQGCEVSAKDLEMLKTQVAYKIVPNFIEFLCCGEKPETTVFKLQENKWECEQT